MTKLRDRLEADRDVRAYLEARGIRGEPGPFFGIIRAEVTATARQHRRRGRTEAMNH